MKTSELYSLYIETVRNPRSRRTYESIFKSNALPALGNLEVEKAKPIDFVVFFKNLETKKEWTTAVILRSVLSGMFNYAVDLGIISYSPITRAVKIKHEKPSKPETPSLDVQSMKSFIESTPKENLKLIYLLAAFCGLRRSEIFALKKEDFIDGMVHIQRAAQQCPGNGTQIQLPKRDKDRLVPVPDFVYKAIPEGTGYVFEKQTKPRDINYCLRAMCRAKGIKEFSVHALRHWYATAQLKGGTELVTVSAALGHSNISITQSFYIDRDELIVSKKDQVAAVFA